MTFDPNSSIDSGGVSKRSGAKRGGIIAGGGLGVGLLLLLGSQLLGVDLTGFAPLVNDVLGGSSSSSSNEEGTQLEGCKTGEDANNDDECRMAATTDSLERYWDSQVDGFTPPSDVVLYDGQTSSACGTASNAVGPFYCPSDEAIYLDVSFFDLLSRDYGANDGSLAQMYVLAHEYGHHISNITGDLQKAGNGSGADSGSVRLELQADCYAGAWIGDAANVKDRNGNTYLEPVTKQQLADAMSAAAAVGDDHIQESAGQRVNPDGFTHGTSEQRQKWLMAGYDGGPAKCDTFSASHL